MTSTCQPLVRRGGPYLKLSNEKKAKIAVKTVTLKNSAARHFLKVHYQENGVHEEEGHDKSKDTVDDFEMRKAEFLEQVRMTVEIPSELILNLHCHHYWRILLDIS